MERAEMHFMFMAGRAHVLEALPPSLIAPPEHPDQLRQMGSGAANRRHWPTPHLDSVGGSREIAPGLPSATAFEYSFDFSEDIWAPNCRLGLEARRATVSRGSAKGARLGLYAQSGPGPAGTPARRGRERVGERGERSETPPNPDNLSRRFFDYM